MKLQTKILKGPDVGMEVVLDQFFKDNPRISLVEFRTELNPNTNDLIVMIVYVLHDWKRKK